MSSRASASHLRVTDHGETRVTTAKHPASPGHLPTHPGAPLYDPAFEHDACGIALVADLHGRRSHGLVRQALTALEHLAHRGATGAEVATGDGAGILVQVPAPVPGRRRRLRPARAAAATPPGMVFLPTDADDAAKARRRIGGARRRGGPRRPRLARRPGRARLPGRLGTPGHARAWPRSWWCPAARRRAAGADPATPGPRPAGLLPAQAGRARGRTACYVSSLSARTLVYKGMLTGHQLDEFFPDLSDPTFDSGLALVHSRFSTNTFPSWPLAHPYRYLAHNGEINTLRGQPELDAGPRGAAAPATSSPATSSGCSPSATPTASDSATFDEVLELLHLGGRSLPHAVLMMIPEAWENHTAMDPARRAFYRYHASLMEPWDGPAGVVFTDGTVVGGGARPQRSAPGARTG